MKTPRLIAVMIVLALCLFGFWPEPLLAQRTTTDNEIVYYERLLKRNPRNARAYFGLGDALIRKARESGDPAYFNRAEEVLKRSLEISPRNADVMRHLAYVFYSRHEFGQAATYANKAIEIDSTNADAYGILGDAFLEVGRYDKAEEAYQKMMELEQNLYSYGRLAGLKSIHGDNRGAIADLEQAIQSGKTAGNPKEGIAWAEWQLGSDRFTLGNLKDAEAYYLQALQTYPNYYRALAGMAQVRTAQKRYDEAIDLYQKAIGILPMPEYAAALGDLHVKTRRPELARQLYELVEYIGYLNTLNKVLYNRELAYFYADHDIKLKEGLELAWRELEYRRDIYAYDLLAWSLYKNGKPEEALNPMSEALKLGTKDAKLFFHAGMIYQSLGEREKAKEYLRRAVATNPHFHILYADAAAQTLEELERSLAGVEVQRKGDGG
ncbi:MAG: tetratricopeptide repeat protein [Deltaproteobacteria bacterium]|nr:MAG: tetratricopeptide repeat protein [Deltaproteobacteria bacterium]